MTGSQNSQNQFISVSSIEDGDSDSSGQNEDCNTTIGSMSLRDELQSVSQVLSSLKNACPERSNPARQKKNVSAPNKTKNDFIPKIINYLDIIHNLNVRIIDKIDELSKENLKLRNEVNSSRIQSYASVASGITAKSIGEHSATASSPPSAQPTQPNNYDSTALPELHKISSRVDQLEQNSLSNVLMLQGTALDAIFHEASRNEGASSTSATREAQPENRQPTSLKRSLCDLLQPIVTNISENSFTSASIQGKERKHIMLICNSTDEKNRLVKIMKNARPANLYANDYLTKLRATLLYKARSLKKRFPQIISAYSRNGQIFCKLSLNDKPIALNSIVELNKLEEKIINSNTG